MTSGASTILDALDALDEAVRELKGEDPLNPVVVLAPSQIAAVTARRHLASRGGVAAVEVTTLARYAEALAASQMGGRRPATRTVIASAWRDALQSIPGAFGEVTEHPATVSALARAHRDLRELDERSLDLVASQPLPAPDLVRLHRRVVETLRDQWYDEPDLLSTAAGVAATGSDPVVTYLLQRLTPSEQAFLDALHTARRTVTVVLGNGPTTATQIMHASDADDEVRTVIRDLMTCLEQGRRAVLLYSDARPYGRLLGEQLGQAGITFNGPGSRPVAERAVARTFLELLGLAEHDLPRADLFRTLSGLATRDFNGQRIPTARWERHSRAAGVVSGDHWGARLLTWIESEAEHRDKDSARALHAFISVLRDRFADFPDTWAESAQWAVELHQQLLVDDNRLVRLPPEEQHAHVALLSALRGLAVLDETSLRPSLRSLRELVALDLERSVPRAGRFGDGVFVGPISSARGLSADVTYIVGLSEDLYPGNPAEDVLLPDRIRTQLTGVLPTVTERIADKHQHLLDAMASAPVVVASFPRGDLRQTKGRLPSRWLLPTLRAASGDESLSATKWETAQYPESRVIASGSFAGSLLNTGYPATEQEWRVRAAVAGVLSDVVVDAAADLLAARNSDAFTRFDGNLTGAEGLTDYRLVDLAVSPTALEQYASCPHAFFLQRMLGIQPIENPEDVVSIPASELGTFIHECMDELTKRGDLPGRGEAWSPAHHEALRQIGEAKAADYEGRGITGHQRLWGVEKQRVLTTLSGMLDDDSSWRASIGAAVHSAEVEFGLNDRPPVTIPLPHGAIRMRGSADKVDLAEGRLYVTDIKSGHRSKFSSIKQTDPAPRGAKLQLPAYAYAALAILDVDLPVTAGYWFVHKDSGRIDIDVDDSVRERYAQVLTRLIDGIAHGLFPAIPPAEDDFGWVSCWYCNPDAIGYAGRRREWENKRTDAALRDLVNLVINNEVGDV